MTELKFTLHMAPVAKGRPRFDRRGFSYTPKKTRAAENNIAAQAVQYRPAMPLQSQAHVALTFYMPIPQSMRKRDLAIAVEEQMPHVKKPDLDNLEKSVLDALNEIFWRDDAIIHSVSKRKLYSLRPRIEVYITGE